MPRAIWKGAISFGVVYVPIEVYPATRATHTSFNLLEIKGHDDQASESTVSEAKPRAVRASLPDTLAPELATPADTPPSGDDWRYELKFDGYRVLARVERLRGRTEVRIYTRAGNDWTERFRAQADALRKLDVESAWLDGEAVVLDEQGVPNFQALQNAFDANRPQDILLYLFDLPYLNGEDLRKVPLDERRARLAELMTPLHADTLRCRFKTWTTDGLIRQASFIGLRRDKPASEIVREHQGPPVGSERTTKRSSHTQRAQAATRSSAKSPARTTHRVPHASDEEVCGVRISHPEHVIDAQSGARKIDLVRYFEWVAPWILPHLQKRPVALVRAPTGVGGELFFQKHATRLEVPNVTQHPGLDPGHEALVTIENPAALVGAAQMDTIELHTWNGLVTNLEKPDRVVFDLDPDPALGWDRMIEAARLTHELLNELGLESWCKTSGGKGLHVVVPLARRAGWDDVKDFARAIADHMAGTLPDRFSAKMGSRNREGRIFVDYLRNNRGASTIAAYAPRARPGLGVSVPIAWDELEHTTGGAQWTIANLHERLDASRDDPWAGYAQAKQRVTAALMQRLQRGP